MELNGKELKLENLSVAQMEALEKQIRAKDAAKAEAFARRKDDYVAVRDEMIDSLFGKFEEMHKQLSALKSDAWGDLNSLINMKEEAFGATENQKSHTFTNAKNNLRVCVQEAAIISFDDTAANGAAKIKQYIKTLTNAENGDIIEMLMSLLGPDKEGNLNPRKMTMLFSMKDKTERRLAKEGKTIDPLFSEGVEIIRSSMRYDHNATYIDVQARRAMDNKWESIRLNFASLPVQ